MRNHQTWAKQPRTWQDRPKTKESWQRQRNLADRVFPPSKPINKVQHGKVPSYLNPATAVNL